jgi:hypothetical protein
VKRLQSSLTAHATRRPRARLRWALLPWLLVMPCATACAADRTSPNRVLDDYATALEAGRYRDAYALLSTEAQRDIPYAAFERMARENPDEVEEIARSLRRPVAHSTVTATVTGADGSQLLLVYESGGWRVDASAVDLYSQASPELAMESFVKAFESKRYDVLLRFIPAGQRAGLDANALRAAWEGEQKRDMTQLVQALKASLPTAKVELLGDRATLAYGPGATIELLREQGVWKIEEL